MTGAVPEFDRATATTTVHELSRASASTTPTSNRAILELLSQFTPIELGQLRERDRLFDRLDTKYLLGESDVISILSAVSADYRVLQVEGERISRYRTLYFDTPQLDLYLQHHNHQGVRSKVRTREYLETGDRHLEIKRRIKRGRTMKDRQLVNQSTSVIADIPEALSAARFPDPELLEPSLLNTFRRITLLRLDTAERVTIDLDLHFAFRGRDADLPRVAVVEFKQHRVDRSSPLFVELRHRGFRATRFSKYCIGIALLSDQIKHNAFNPQLRTLRSIIEDERDGR